MAGGSVSLYTPLGYVRAMAAAPPGCRQVSLLQKNLIPFPSLPRPPLCILLHMVVTTLKVIQGQPFLPDGALK
jgi:hypothetical protein